MSITAANNNHWLQASLYRWSPDQNANGSNDRRNTDAACRDERRIGQLIAGLIRSFWSHLTTYLDPVFRSIIDQCSVPMC